MGAALIHSDRQMDRQTDMAKVIDAFPDYTNELTQKLLLTFVRMKLDGLHLQYGSTTFLRQRATTEVVDWFTDRTCRNDCSGIPIRSHKCLIFTAQAQIYKCGRGLRDRTWSAACLRSIIYSIVNECGASRCEIAAILAELFMTRSKVSNSRRADERLKVGKWERYAYYCFI
jgi:hypothetical protein